MTTILFIDGENFINKLKEVLRAEKIQDPEWHKYDFQGLLNHVLQGINATRRIFYFAKLSEHEDTKKKSNILIQKRRLLKNYLQNQQKFEVIMAGHVRGQYKETINQKPILIFKEKGVDVRIAVDIVSLTCDGQLEIAVLASSDSDLQPAVREIRKRNKQVIYLGFENSPNKGLTFTTNRTILIRNSEILDYYPKQLI